MQFKYTLAFVILLLVCGTSFSQSPPRAMTWEDLLPQDMEFEDPFEALTPEQLSNLSIIARMRMLEEQKPEAVTEATRLELNGVEARMPGYLLPLDYSENRVHEFLLVPRVGACIHTPPPPKNQIVYVKLEKGYKSTSRFEAVWAEGVMSTEAKSSELYLVDGTDDITTGYSMKANEIERYKQ
jgi:hypothetical protein